MTLEGELPSCPKITNLDIHRFDEDGFLFIGGRQKEIIVTGGGENVAPVPIEDTIKVQMKDIVSNCMVLGDKRKHLACILTLRTVLDAANLPTDEVGQESVYHNMPHEVLEGGTSEFAVFYCCT